MRVRLQTMRQPDLRAGAVMRSLAIEAVVLASRLALFASAAAVVRRFNPEVAAALDGLMIIAIFWMRETLGQLIRSYSLGIVIPFVSLAHALAGVATLATLAALGWGPLSTAAAALLARDVVAFAGFVLAALAGTLGVRAAHSDQTSFDEEGDLEEADAAPSGESALPVNREDWRQLVGENMFWSRVAPHSFRHQAPCRRPAWSVRNHWRQAGVRLSSGAMHGCLVRTAVAVDDGDKMAGRDRRRGLPYQAHGPAPWLARDRHRCSGIGVPRAGSGSECIILASGRPCDRHQDDAGTFPRSRQVGDCRGKIWHLASISTIR